MIQAEEHAGGGNRRQERTEEFGEGDGEGGQAAAHDEAEEGPAEEERRARAVGLAEVDVLAARFGVHRPELGERQGPAERDQPARQPDREKIAGRGEPRGDDPGRHINARTDDGADDQECGVDQSHTPKESGFGPSVLGHGE